MKNLFLSFALFAVLLSHLCALPQARAQQTPSPKPQPASAAQAVLYVDPASGNDGNDGFSWGTAKRTVQGAQSALNGGTGTIYVAGSNGGVLYNVYQGGINIGGGRTPFEIQESLYGPANLPQFARALILNRYGYSGGTNIYQNGFVSKTENNGISDMLSNYTPSQTAGVVSVLTQYSLGDSLPASFQSHCYGGLNAGGDEGCEAIDIQAYQETVELTSTISAGASAGSTLVTIATPSAGKNTQGAGRWLVDTTQKYNAGTIASITQPTATTPAIFNGSGTDWGVSTISTMLGTAVKAPGTATVTPASMAGISQGTVLVVADPQDYETVAVSSVSGGSFTATFAYPHPATAIVANATARGAGSFFDPAGDDVSPAIFPDLTNTLHYVLPIIQCTSATACEVWISDADSTAWSVYTGTELAPKSINTYAIYPGAIISSVGNGAALSSTLNLEPNVTPWALSDAVAIPQYPFISTVLGQWVVRGGYFPPIAGISNGGINLMLQGRPAGTRFQTFYGIEMSNTAPGNAYPAGGAYNNPVAFGVFGPYSSLARLNAPPSAELIDVPYGTAGASYKLFNNTSTSDSFMYAPKNAWWGPVQNSSGDAVYLSPAGTDGYLVIHHAGYYSGLTLPAVTAPRSWALPDASGKVCIQASGAACDKFSGTITLGTRAIPPGACASPAATVSAPGVTSSDAIASSPAVQLSRAAGFAPSAAGTLTIYPPWVPVAGTIQVDVCNSTSAPMTPGPVTLNLKVPY
jgi:hypothetical protein